MKTLLCLLLVLSFSLMAREQGYQCTSHAQCDEGTACIDGYLSLQRNPWWGGITVKQVKDLMAKYKDGYNFGSNSENDMHDYTKTYTAPAIVSVTSSSGSLEHNYMGSTGTTTCYRGSSSTSCNNLKLKLRTGSGKCNLRTQVPVGTDLAVGGPCDLHNSTTSGTYGTVYSERKYTHGSTHYKKTSWKVMKKTFRFDALHIFRYYYNAKYTDSGSDKTYYQLLDTSCNKDNIEEDKCEITAEIMTIVLNHLEEYRNYRKKEGYNTGLGYTLSTSDSACREDVQCYSFRCEGNKCIKPLKMCSCALLDTKPVSGTSQQCCQLDPSGIQTVFINPDSGKCSNEFIPRDPFDDYTIKIKGDEYFEQKDFQSVEELTGDSSGQITADHCEFEIKFDNPNDNVLTEYQFTTGLDDGLTQNEKLRIALDRYINNDYLIMGSLEWLFIDTYSTCNPSGQSWSEDWATMMKTKVATHLKISREAGNSSYLSMTEELKEKIARVTWSLQNDQNFDGYKTIDAFQDQIEIESARLRFENALLYGQPTLSPINLDTGLARVILGMNDNNDKTVFEEIKDRYDGVQYKWKWFLNAPDWFRCSSPRWSAWKLSGKDAWQARYKIKDSGFTPGPGGVIVGTLFPVAGVVMLVSHLFNPSDYYIDPPVPDSIGFDDGDFSSSIFLGTAFGNNTRKIDTGDMGPVMRSKLSDYFAMDSEQNTFSFLSTSDKESLKTILTSYAYKFFGYYSKRGGGRNHKVGNRVSKFFPRAEAAMFELNHYLYQLTEARKKRIQCLVHHKKIIQSTNTANAVKAIKSEGESMQQTDTDGNNNISSDTIELNPDTATTDEARSDMTFDLDAASGDGSSSSGSASDLSSGGTTTSSSNSSSDSSSTSNGSTESTSESYNNAVNKRKKHQQNLLNALIKANGKEAVEAVSKEPKTNKEGAKFISKLFSNSAGFGAMNGINNGNTNSASASASKKKSSDDSSNRNGSGSSGDSSNSNGSNFDFSGIYGSMDSGHSSSGGIGKYNANDYSSENKEMLKSLNQEVKRGKYNNKESDTLFTKITKIYFRSAYKKLLKKKKKSSAEE